MANRCLFSTDLEVHHINRSNGNDIINAEVLCYDCQKNTKSYGVTGFNPPEFASNTIFIAKVLAGNRCECTRENCH